MQTFIDTETNKIWEVDDGINLSDYSHFPETLIPHVILPDTDERRLELWQVALRDEVNSWLNNIANKHGYFDIMTACSYAACDNLYQAEGIAFVQWRSNVWDYVFKNNSTIVDIKTFISQLPQITI